MRGYVGVTDYGWYRHLQARPHLDEVNFWRPGGTSFKVLPPGGLFFFKLKTPQDAIAGFGQFARFERMPLWLAWGYRDPREARPRGRARGGRSRGHLDRPDDQKGGDRRGVTV